MDSKTGVLLINLGTPDAPTAPALRSFLDEFLNDPYVVDFPRWLWKPILEKIILRTRPEKSARLYKQIWGKNGSPLLVISQSITAKLGKKNPEIQFALGMRYGNPSIQSALTDLQQAGVDHLVIFPLFPQYSSTTTQTALDLSLEVTNNAFTFSNITLIEDYHDHPEYITALADTIRKNWGKDRPEKLLFSFHSIPERYIHRRGEPYRQHCEATTGQVVEKLELTPSEYVIAYQSRFGPGKWLQPATDQVLEDLGENKTSSLSVVCPGFAADCLETLEEIEGEGKEIYSQAGGAGYSYIPCLNDEDLHIDALSNILLDALKGKP